MTTKLNIVSLKRFLVKAKRNTYALDNSKEVIPEKPLHKESEYEEGEFYYRDSYVGFFQAPGIEEVRFGKQGKTVWSMAYSGGMLKEFQTHPQLALQTFNFLKQALSLVSEKIPYRGPKKLIIKDWKYINKIKGTVERFTGYEKILFQGKPVFSQDYIGGLVLDK